jgi:hypothetical protein
MTTPGRYRAEDDGKDPKGFHVLDTTGQNHPINCKNLVQAERIAELNNLDEEAFRRILDDCWPDEYVVDSTLKAMGRLRDMILDTDTENDNREYVIEKATSIITEASIVILFTETFLRRIKPDWMTFDIMMLQARHGLTQAQVDDLWKSWKGAADA